MPAGGRGEREVLPSGLCWPCCPWGGRGAEDPTASPSLCVSPSLSPAPRMSGAEGAHFRRAAIRRKSSPAATAALAAAAASNGAASTCPAGPPVWMTPAGNGPKCSFGPGRSPGPAIYGGAAVGTGAGKAAAPSCPGHSAVRADSSGELPLPVRLAPGGLCLLVKVREGAHFSNSRRACLCGEAEGSQEYPRGRPWQLHGPFSEGVSRAGLGWGGAHRALGARAASVYTFSPHLGTK